MSDDGKHRDNDQRTELKVFVGGLSWQMKDSDLRDAFSKYDPIEASIIVDKNTQRSRGFGFVFFKDKLGMEDAIRDMHDKELDGRKISVVKAVPQNETKPGTPAVLLGGGAGARRGETRYGGRDYRDRGGYDRGYDRYGYDRGGAPYDRGGGYGGYDPRYSSYDRSGYDRGGYGGYGAPYGRDPYGRDPYASSYSGYGGYERGYEPAYDHRYPDYRTSYDDRGAGGADRRAYAAPRTTPYDRAPERRPEARR
mmetsp:Transcript_20779/g.45471  ORF Transcript_20779/g.45471 Transcript_20779/m.45471 type:complete len:252 (-) Transcript_20779:1202-1957(-)